jgi:hypothetical protein
MQQQRFDVRQPQDLSRSFQLSNLAGILTGHKRASAALSSFIKTCIDDSSAGFLDAAKKIRDDYLTHNTEVAEPSPPRQ